MKDTPFTADRLLALYDQVAEAEDAIPRLRRFVLDLAVHGKLVAQDPSDEPAAELLMRIAKEKARLVKAGEIKDRTSARRTGGATVFPLPQSWEMSDLQSICTSVTDGDHLPPPKADEGVPFLVIGDVRTKTINFSGDRFVAQEYYDALDLIRRPKSGDLLYTLVGSYGIPVLVTDDRPFCVQRHIGILRPCKDVDVGFLARIMESNFVFDQATICATGIAQKTVPLSGLRNIKIPLPPLAEQQRIVAKVDELMALCDRLQAARAGREAVRDRLTAATLTRLTAPETDAETFPTHALFALQTLPTLTTRPDQIKTLRQTILNLAVRGKLVAQDPTDEPAAELLKRISRSKADRVKSGIIPKKPEPVRDAAWDQGAIPEGWIRIALGQVADLVTSGSRGWGEFYSSAGPGFVRAQNIRFGKLRLDDLACVNPPSNSEGSRTQVVRNDLLIVITGAGVTNPALLDQDLGEAYVSQHVGLVRPTDTALSLWLLHCLMAEAGGRAELVERAYGAGKPGLNLDNIRNLTIPLPPLAEQHRIVAKVDALMALCDRLEANLTTTATTRSRLLEGLLHVALSGQTEAAA